MSRSSNRAPLGVALTVVFLVAACGGGSPAATPTPAPPSAAPTQAAATAPAAPTEGATGPAALQAVDTIEAGKLVEVTWTGPNAHGDYVTIVLATATKWTNEDYFYTTEGSPASLTVPSADGAYELWYVSGDDSAILARHPLTVTPFQGALLGPDEVVANTEFEVAWNGPDGPGDYVTIVKAGAERWTNEDYFYTGTGSPGELLAPLEAGAYELWYVIGSDSTVQARRPITVTAATATLEAPGSVAHASSFQVTWTGPDGAGDYVTIVPKGAAEGTYASYFYTGSGSPGTLVAPDTAGEYELRYVAGQSPVTLVRLSIKVT